MPELGSRWVKTLAAAARLAGIYAIAVLILLVPFALFIGIGATDLKELLLGLPLLAAGGFLVGFLLLAIARRVGFAILWFFLLLLWINVIREASWSLGLLPRFPGWTVFAAPLYVLTAIGLSGGANARSLIRELLITAGLWATLVALALKFSYLDIDVGFPGAPYGTARALANVCGVFPFLLTTRELLRVARALRAPSQTVAAA
jgi:hypothetical protein